jgi:TPR repeat protein
MKRIMLAMVMVLGFTSAIRAEDAQADPQALAEKAGQGDTAACIRLAEMHETGNGVAKDPATAAIWWLKAAELGDAKGQARIGAKLLGGDGIAKNQAAAMEWLAKASAQGDPDAMMTLGNIHIAGKGVPKNSTEAAKWFGKAAEKGLAAAQCQMARMHLAGAGVPKDDIEAYQWATRAAEQQNADAKRILIFLNQRMTPDEIAVAKIAAKGFPAPEDQHPPGEGLPPSEEIPLFLPPIE